MTQAHFTRPEDETSPERSQRVGAAQAAFDTIRVDYPPQTGAIASLDETRIAGLNRQQGAPCGGTMMVAPHGAGKTEAIRLLRDIVRRTASEESVPVLHVEINTSGTTDSISTSILTALGAARPSTGTEKLRWPRAIAEIRRFGVQLIVFDEFNRAARRPTMSRAIATTIRERIMDAGVAPVAFVGSEDAGAVLSQAPELLERLEDEIDLSPLQWVSKGDRSLFQTFVDDLDEALVSHGLMACKSDLAGIATARPLWEASSGRIRRICKVVRHAMSTSLRDGRSFIGRNDLADAVDAYCIKSNFCDHNPFV
jgi:hypothetical protein